MLTAEERRSIGCGLEPLGEAPSIWEPARSRLGYQGEAPKVCPTYTTGLPEVHEAARARVHWSKGQIEAFTGEHPSELLLSAVEILDAECAQYEAWATTDVKHGGGRGAE